MSSVQDVQRMCAAFWGEMQGSPHEIANEVRSQGLTASQIELVRAWLPPAESNSSNVIGGRIVQLQRLFEGLLSEAHRAGGTIQTLPPWPSPPVQASESPTPDPVPSPVPPPDPADPGPVPEEEPPPVASTTAGWFKRAAS